MTIKAIILYISTLLYSYFPQSAYVEGVLEQPKSFFPSKALSQHEKSVTDLAYRGLFKYDIYGELIPDLADTWEIEEDGLVYTIKIKDNNYWSNGKKISADDLIYTSFKMPSLAGVATDKVDDLTVRYVLPNKYSPFLSLLTTGIMPVNQEEKGNPLLPVTNGDFKIARVEKTGDVVRKLVLTTSSNKYKIKKIVFKYYSNVDELSTAAKLGEINAFLDDKTHDLENFTNYKFPTQGIYYALYFNLRDDKMADLDFRKKLEKVLPISQIVADKGITVQGPISRSSYTDVEINFDRYDETFKEDLQDTKIRLTVPDTSRHTDMAEVISEYWENRLDVDVDIIKLSPENFFSQVIEPRNFQVMLYGQEIGRDPDRYSNWYSTEKDPPGLNLSGFNQVRADRALEEGRKELDNDKRIIHYNELQKSVIENVPAIFLYHPFTNYYVSNYIKGIGEKYTFSFGDRFLDLPNWEIIKTN